MSSACGRDLREILSQVPDPRGRKGRRHSLSAMLTAVVCGVLCGARGYLGVVEWLHPVFLALKPRGGPLTSGIGWDTRGGRRSTIASAICWSSSIRRCWKPHSGGGSPRIYCSRSMSTPCPPCVSHPMPDVNRQIVQPLDQGLIAPRPAQHPENHRRQHGG